MSGFTHLPEDIILRILAFLPPPDIVRLRQVSKTLCSATQQPVVWIRAYKNAALPRPPGPYLHAGDQEGLKFVERALVQSAKLEPWSARGFNPHPVRTHTLGEGDFTDVSHFPQWGSFIITTFKSSVVYRNLNSDDPQNHVLIDVDDYEEYLAAFLFADAVTLAGHPVTYMLLKDYRPTYPLTLLKIVGHFSSSLSLEAAIPLSFSGHSRVNYMAAGPRYVCISASFAPLLGRDGEFTLALLDVTTDKMYHLPAFKSSLGPEIPVGRPSFELTDTHILAFMAITKGVEYYIQAFRLPLEVDSGATAEGDGMLRMTHEGICKITKPPEYVLRGNKVTNVGGVETTEIRLMIADRREWSAVDLTLTASSSSSFPGIGTITLSQSTPLVSRKDGSASLFVIRSSEDGFGRGVCYFRGFKNDHLAIQTFSVDASGPVCRVDVGERRDAPMLFLSGMRFDVWSGTACNVLGAIKVYNFVPFDSEYSDTLLD